MTKTALITGASRGLGAALAEALAQKYHVIAVARTVGGLEELDDRIQAKGGRTTLAPMDITNGIAMATLCRSIHDRWGYVDFWAHTAVHAAPLTPTAHIDEKDLAKSMTVNVTATARLISYVAPLLDAASRGQAVFFDDPRAGEKFFGAYAASKSAQIALAKSWEAETANTETQIRILNPPPMPTATRGRFFPGEDRNRLTDPYAAASALLKSIS